MRCPYCEHEESKVLDSRPVEDGVAIRRRRECLGCGRRFTTYERVDHVPLMVVKRDGRREPFNRDKILAGLVKAAGKRPISMEALETLVQTVEREIRNRGDREVPSVQIGEMVMERLRHLDDVAYVRFASEHRRFQDVDTLVEEIETLKARKAREAAGRAQVPLIPLPNGTEQR
ncbi:MAG: transcriptional regulator NrdR [Armatimonadota bacterium]|nr:transcriptional regulator NrdR [Armatimonadota bacterium]MDR7428342.1 transcriptional regulator NrdR [Armatimonadota bacterium]MDR7464786.1 transcriptional regulator NrdR [Armatimonadota bacterium]MDR7470317.1 transcriptional regulator NrdR [Armatimonadota bacterium]MDR7475275.1 transcriptional regulator NrdR [Armatimonadota bacterium]